MEKVRFDPCTGCVEWTGARTRGQGHTAWYGSFWDGERSVLVHRWAAKHVHGMDVPDDMQVDHECRNTLCVQHLQVVTAQVNREYQWIRVQVGLLPAPPEYERDPDDVPYYLKPEWVKQ